MICNFKSSALLPLCVLQFCASLNRAFNLVHVQNYIISLLFRLSIQVCGSKCVALQGTMT